MTTDQDKEKLKSIRQLKKILTLIPKDRKAVGEKLVAELIFMDDTLTKLKQTITEKGVMLNAKQKKRV